MDGQTPVVGLCDEKTQSKHQLSQLMDGWQAKQTKCFVWPISAFIHVHEQEAYRFDAFLAFHECNEFQSTYLQPPSTLPLTPGFNGLIHTTVFQLHVLPLLAHAVGKHLFHRSVIIEDPHPQLC